jgi:hypothetical protein
MLKQIKVSKSTLAGLALYAMCLLSILLYLADNLK